MKKSGSRAMLILAVSIFGVYMGNAHILRGNNKNTMLEMKAYSNCKVCQIYSKEGYTNVRKGPSKDYGIIEKIKNETYATVMQDFGEWKYVNYFHTDDPDPEFEVYSKHGFVHKSQLKELY